MDVDRRPGHSSSMALEYATTNFRGTRKNRSMTSSPAARAHARVIGPSRTCGPGVEDGWCALVRRLYSVVDEGNTATNEHH